MKKPRKMPQSQRDILEALTIFGDWVRPRDVGAAGHSSGRLACLYALVKKRLTERRPQSPVPSRLDELRGTALHRRLAPKRKPKRPSQYRTFDAYEYRITDAGRALHAQLNNSIARRSK